VDPRASLSGAPSPVPLKPSGLCRSYRSPLHLGCVCHTRLLPPLTRPLAPPPFLLLMQGPLHVVGPQNPSLRAPMSSVALSVPVWLCGLPCAPEYRSTWSQSSPTLSSSSPAWSTRSPPRTSARFVPPYQCPSHRDGTKLPTSCSMPAAV
jgi:hypothetical protein